MFARVLIDTCVLFDSFLDFREGHQEARRLLGRFAEKNALCHIPSHAYFELTVAAMVHYKRDPQLLADHPIELSALPHLNLQVVALDKAYVERLCDTLLGAPKPDLKSQDLIYFCIAREKGLTLITGDRKLRNVARAGGLSAFHADEALAILDQSQQPAG